VNQTKNQKNRTLYTADLRGRFVGRQNRVATSFGETETEGFQVFDIRMGFRPWKNVSAGTVLLNIFDVNYHEHLNRGYRNFAEPGLIYEPGRKLTSYLKYEW